jgi:hypothetical protein
LLKNIEPTVEEQVKKPNSPYTTTVKGRVLVLVQTLKKKFILRINIIVPDQDKISNCTKIQVLQETKFPESYYQVVRFLDNIEANSKKVPGSIYHDQTLFRVLFYQEIKYEFCKSKAKYPEIVYTLAIYPTVLFNILVHTVYGNFPIDRHVQEATENLYTSNIPCDIDDPR